MSFQADDANALAQMVRDLLPQCLIVKGGVHETAGGFEYSLGCHAAYVDVCVLGEGEDAFRTLVDRWADKRRAADWRDTPGLAYQDHGHVHVNETCEGGIDPNEVIPLRRNHHCSYDFPVFENRKTAQMMTARGCAERCFFCYDSHGSRAVRRRHEDSLRAELEILRRDGYEAVYFDDPTFTDDREHVSLLCRLMREHRLVWGCNTRVDRVTREMTLEMRASGCVYVFCGVESLVPGVLLGLNKTRDPVGYIAAAQRAYRWLADAAIPRSVFLIFGGPKEVRSNGCVEYTVEQWDDIEQTLRDALALDPDYLSMNILRLLPDLPVSYGARFAYLRPEGAEIHAGYYDKTWLKTTGRPDYRSHHEIYSAFEGRGSVNPAHMTIEQCYRILARAVELANDYFRRAGKVIHLVVGDAFEKKYLGRPRGQYKLAPLSEMMEL